MNRSIVLGGITLMAITAGMVYGLYWYYRIPPQIVASEATVGDVAIYKLEDTIQTSDAVAIPPIYDPIFESVGAADVYLKEDGEGLDVEIDGRHRFYPYQLLVWHELVHDEFGGESILITYAPLSGVGMVFNRTVQDQTLEFATLNRVWNGTQLFEDTVTHSLWSQMLAQSVDGSMQGAGLARIKSETMTWSTWKSLYPNEKVLSRETGTVRDYTRDPYQAYATSSTVWYPTGPLDARVALKTPVVLVTVADVRRVYVLEDLRRLEHIDDQVGTVAFRLVHDKTTGRVTIETDSERSIWLDTGYWFAFASTFPNIELYQP
jgi:hypothetical protein